MSTNTTTPSTLSTTNTVGITNSYTEIHPEVLAAIKADMQEEMGDDILPEKERVQLLQKYGILSPQFIKRERKDIQRETGKRGSYRAA